MRSSFTRGPSAPRKFTASRHPTGAGSCTQPFGLAAVSCFSSTTLRHFSDGRASSPKALSGTPVTIHHYVEDCDAAIKRAANAGATVRMPAQDMFWGDRYGVVTDPFGHNWSFATHLKDLTPAELQAAMKETFAQHS